MTHLLVVDDDEGVCEFVRDVAQEAGFTVDTAATFDEFQARYEEGQVDTIVLDLQMPDVDGVEYLRILSERSCAAGIVLISGFDARVLHTVMAYGEKQGLRMLGSLGKPIPLADLQDILERALVEFDAVTPEELDAAIRGHELFLEFQPKVRLPGAVHPERTTPVELTLGGTVCNVDSLEALIRWQHPTRGLLPPARFIPLAESRQLILPLTDFVIDTAIEAMARWAGAGFEPAVAFNFPPQLLTDLGFPDRLARKADDAGISRQRLILEITETAAMMNATRSMDILSRVRLKGLHLSMDDFGTGYSSLVQLHRMPFSELKIDRSVVMDMDRDEGAVTIVRSIVDLAHTLGLGVCAEGVENKEIVRILQDLGCDTAQGYFFSHPLGETALLEAAGIRASNRPQPPTRAGTPSGSSIDGTERTR